MAEYSRFLAGIFGGPIIAAGVGDEEVLARPDVRERNRRSDEEKESNIKRHGFLRGSYENLKKSFGFGGEPPNKGGESPDEGEASSRRHASPTGKWWTPERMKYAADYLVENAGLSKWGAAGLVARWSGVESPGGPDSVNKISGAQGIIQALGSRQNASTLGTFKEQLANAARELNTTEKRAGDLGRSAKTAIEGQVFGSAYERAENYNRQSDWDNFTDKTPARSVYDTLYGSGANPWSKWPQGPGTHWDNTKQARVPDTSLWTGFGGIPSSSVGLPQVAPWLHGAPASTNAGGGGDTTNVHAPITTTINVNGADDPSIVAHMVALGQSRVSADAARNLQGAVQ
jgi:hypothetical protein